MSNNKMFKELIELSSSTTKGNQQRFDKLLVVYLGATPKEYFPKERDAFGRVLKDGEGRDIRSGTPSGWTYKFATLGESTKIVMAVVPTQIEVDICCPLYVSGYGYDIKSGNMVFLEGAEVIDLIKESERN